MVISRDLVRYLVDRMTAIPVSKLAQLVEGDKFHDLVPNDGAGLSFFKSNAICASAAIKFNIILPPE